MNYLGAPQQSSFTLNFSRGASHVVSQYFKLVSLGRKGYTRVLLELVRMAEYLASKLQGMGCFVLLSPQPLGRRQLGLPLVAFRLRSYDAGFDEFAISYELRRQGGWVVPAYTMAPHAEEVKLLRVVVREDLTLDLCDKLVADLCVVLQRLNKRASRSVGQGTDSACDRKFAE
jgi:glutamate decarboxylase